MRWQEVGGHRWPDWVRQRVGALLGRPRHTSCWCWRRSRCSARSASDAHRCRSEAGRSPCICGSSRVPRRGGADARGRGGPPTVGADGACRPGSGRCGGRCAARRHVPEVGSANYLLCWASGVPDRNLLARWATARTPHPALRGFGSHSGGGVARVALLPDQHGRSTWRSRAEQLPSDRGTARVRRGANRAPGRRGARRDAVAAAITMAAAAGSGEQERDGDLPVADGARRRRRTGRLSDRVFPSPSREAGRGGCSGWCGW